jgi:Uma2 family endonuclease
MALPWQTRYSVEEYLALEQQSAERLEYEDGHIYAMAGESGEHNEVVTNIILALTESTRAKGCRLRHQNVKLMLGTKFYYPDLMILCGPPPSDSHIEADPCFVAEVLSPSTAWRDRGRKLNAYLKIPALERYILVNTLVRQVGIYSRTPQGWFYDSLEEGAVEIPCTQATLTLDQIYQNIPLEPQ